MTGNMRSSEPFPGVTPYGTMGALALASEGQRTSIPAADSHLPAGRRGVLEVLVSDSVGAGGTDPVAVRCGRYGWRQAILRSGLPPLTRCVAFVLSMHMDDDGGSCFPSMETIADETGMAKRSVVNHVEKLDNMKWIIVSTTKGVRGRRNTYFAAQPSDFSLGAPPALSAPVDNPEPDDDSVHDTTPLGASDDTTRCTTCTRVRHESVRRSSSSSDEDDPPTPTIRAASRIHADRKLATKKPGSVANESGWLLATAANWIKANRHHLNDLDDGRSPADLVDAVDRARKTSRKPVVAFCQACSNKGVIELDDGSCIQCDCSTRRRSIS